MQRSADSPPATVAGGSSPQAEEGPARIQFDPASGPQDIAAFHDELRRRNLPNLAWTVGVFNLAYLAWVVFDYHLAPDHWRSFLTLRLIAVAINTATVLLVTRAGLRRYTFEAFAVVGLTFGGFIAPMLPAAGDATFAYIMGFTIVVFGLGLLPYWPPRLLAAVLGMTIAAGSLAFLVWPATADFRTYLGSAFFVLTAAGLSLAAGLFKYDLARRDFFTRAELEEVARREAEANDRLGATTAELRAALDKLKELDRLKSQFFANVSHELRTPLTLILAPVDELLASVSDPAAARALGTVRRNAERLLRLINDLLDLSRLDAGGLRLNVAEIDLCALAATVHENSLPAAHAKSIEFTLDLQPSPCTAWGDAHRLEIVLTNLVGNALKFTPAGGRVELRVAASAAGMRLEVSDNGPGIPAEAVGHVFERFFQVSSHERRREGGVGIGLALAKELVELHGGTLTVDSRLGEGSTFAVELPTGRGHIRPEAIERRQAATRGAAPRRRTGDPGAAAATRRGTTAPLAAEPALPYRGRRPRVLLAEDNTELREFIEGLLERDHEVAAVVDGDEAWRALQEDPPDLVLSDVMMPGRSGTDLCREIKAHPALNAIPVILLTAKVGSEATLDGYAHGADDFIAKPFHPQVLLARVRAQLQLRELGLQLAQREKLAVVGTLAAGILHEVRNPLNAILNAARVLAEGRTEPELAQRLLAIITDGAGRIQGITAALEAHARPSEDGGLGQADARAGLDATLRLLEHRLEGVTVRREYSTETAAAVPPGPLNQVLLNLVDNALRSGAKTLWLGVEAAAGRVRIRVADDGPGVPHAIAARIFDPFYSTRKVGEGTGLGLYLSRRIVENHDGTLWLEDRPGGGAVFVIDLPAAGFRPKLDAS